MARILTENQKLQAAAFNARPISILKIEFGGAVGTKWFSDRDLGDGDGSTALNAQARVISWGTITQAYREQSENPVGDVSITLHDADLQLKTWHDAVEFQGKPITLYQHFADLPAGDILPVMVGVINAPLRWSEAPDLRFDITDISSLYARDIGTTLDPEEFSMLAGRDENAVVPLVFGRVERGPMLGLRDGAVTELARDDSLGLSTKLFMRDAEKFPQETPITIHVGLEIIAGSFSGNTFNVTEREVKPVESSVVTTPRDSVSFYDSSLGGIDGQFTHRYIRIVNPRGIEQMRLITRYSAAEGCVVYNAPFSRIGMDNPTEPFVLPAGYEYSIISLRQPHRAGTRVFLGGEDYVYLVNDAPSRAAPLIEARGRLVRDEEHHRTAWGEAETTWTTYGPAYEGYVAVEPSLYTVNLNDESVFGAGHPVTTVTFPRHPAEFYRDADDFHASVEGVESEGDGSGELVVDPSDVISTLLTRFAGAPTGALDLDSFEQAKTDGTQWLRFAFVHQSVTPAHRMAADLAFQARSALCWEDGKARLVFLRNKLGDAEMTLSPDNLDEESLEIESPGVDDLVTEVRAEYVRRGLPGAGPSSVSERETVIARDDALESEIGRRSRRIDLWAYGEREYAASVAGYWLSRLSFPWRRIKLRSFLPPLAMLRQDVVELDWPAYFGAGPKARVITVNHAPGAGEQGRIDSISLELEAPLKPGCSGTCETDCEGGDETGCHTVCEAAVETCWQCETACEDGCEIYCTTASMTGCITNDAGCGNQCETECSSTQAASAPSAAGGTISTPSSSAGSSSPPTAWPSTAPSQWASRPW